MNNDSLIQWLDAVISAKGYGSRTEAAEALGISPGGITRLLQRKSGFDDKTVRLMSWIITSKAENYPKSKVVEKHEKHGILIEKRITQSGEQIYTWRTP